jgi:hypothetical protein
VDTRGRIGQARVTSGAALYATNAVREEAQLVCAGRSSTAQAMSPEVMRRVRPSKRTGPEPHAGFRGLRESRWMAMISPAAAQYALDFDPLRVSPVDRLRRPRAASWTLRRRRCPVGRTLSTGRARKRLVETHRLACWPTLAKNDAIPGLEVVSPPPRDSLAEDTLAAWLIPDNDRISPFTGPALGSFDHGG